MQDYSDIGFDKRLRKIDSFAQRPVDFKTAAEQDVIDERSPWAPPTFISRGTLQTRGGGLPQFRSTLGTSAGTVLMDVNPATGTTTIRGGLIAQQTLDLGTINNTAIAGTPSLIGTLTNNRLINNGTWNNGTLGTPAITGGTGNAMVLGSPTVVGGTIQSLQAGTMISPSLTGTIRLDTAVGSSALGASGNFAIQTHTGSAVLVARLNGTTFFFASAGTLA